MDVSYLVVTKGAIYQFIGLRRFEHALIKNRYSH